MAYIWNELKVKEGEPAQIVMTAGPFMGLVEELQTADGVITRLKCQVRIATGVLMESSVEREGPDEPDERFWMRGRARTEFVVVGMLMSALAGVDGATLANFVGAAEALLEHRGKLSGLKATDLAGATFDELFVQSRYEEEAAADLPKESGDEKILDEVDDPEGAEQA